MRRYHYLSFSKFAKGIHEIAGDHENPEEMPILLSVDGKVAPFGLCLKENIDGVPCMVLTGHSENMKNVTAKTWKSQIKCARKDKRDGNR